PAPLRNLDAAALAECAQRFSQEFGEPLLWLGGDEFRGKMEGLDGIAGPGAGGWIDIGRLTPGRDNSALEPLAVSAAPSVAVTGGQAGTDGSPSASRSEQAAPAI